MTSKKLISIELGFVSLLLLVLLITSIPRFFSSQVSRLEGLIQLDLETILQALEAYVVDYPECSQMGVFRRNVIYPADAIFAGGVFWSEVRREHGDGERDIPVQGLRSQMRLKNFPKLAEYLAKHGYLEQDSAFDFFQTNQKDLNFFMLTESTRKWDEDNERFPDFAISIGIAVPWPFTNEELKRVYFQDELRGELFYEFEKPSASVCLLRREFYFDPSNGLNSFGFIYRDTLGNTSTPRE